MLLTDQGEWHKQVVAVRLSPQLTFRVCPSKKRSELRFTALSVSKSHLHVAMAAVPVLKELACALHDLMVAVSPSSSLLSVDVQLVST